MYEKPQLMLLSVIGALSVLMISTDMDNRHGDRLQQVVLLLSTSSYSTIVKCSGPSTPSSPGVSSTQGTGPPARAAAGAKTCSGPKQSPWEIDCLDPLTSA